MTYTFIAIDGHRWIYSKSRMFRFCTYHPNELEELVASGTLASGALYDEYKPAKVKTH